MWGEAEREGAGEAAARSAVVAGAVVASSAPLPKGERAGACRVASAAALKGQPSLWTPKGEVAVPRVAAGVRAVGRARAVCPKGAGVGAGAVAVAALLPSGAAGGASCRCPKGEGAGEAA